VVAVTLLSGHVAPSVDDNNRYLKLTPLGDRVRLAYTVFYGEVPGASERRTIDANHDGKIDDAEAHAFGAEIAAKVAAALVVVVDDHPQPVRWATIDVGMGTPVVAAGAFSVDLVAYLCLPVARGRHHVNVYARFRVPRPGETEARVEDSPGVTIERARVGRADDPTFTYRFAGPGGPLETEGLDLEFVAGPQAIVTLDGQCRAARPARRRRGAIVAIAVGLAVSVLLTLRWRARGRRAER
jgi:hypothetical protein